MSRLWAGSPAMIAGPLSPPFSSASRESRRKPPIGVLSFALWQP